MKINELDKGGVTQQQLDALEKVLDQVFSKVGIDIEFTRHFVDRVNDERNIRPISIKELAMLFKKEFIKYGKPIAQLGPDAQAVMKDLESDINIPFALEWNGKELELIAKTVMRKKNFKTPNKEFAVEKKKVKEGPFKGVGKALMKRKLNKQYKKSDLANFDDSGIDTSGKTRDEINQMKSDYYHDHMDKADRAKKAGDRLSRKKIAEDFGSVPPLAELIIMAVVAKTTVSVLIGMFKVAIKTGKGLNKLRKLHNRIKDMGEDIADYANPQHEAVAPASERFMDAALKALHRLVSSKGNRQSVGGYAFDIARAFNGVNAKQLEKIYNEKFGE